MVILLNNWFIKKFIDIGNVVSVNQSFKKQLYDNLKCETLDINNSKSLGYSRNDLIDFFQKYNTCSDVGSKIYEGSQKRGKVNLWVKAGYFDSGFDFTFNQGLVFTTETTIPFNNQGILSIGAEIEFILPVGKNKWSIFIDPSYQSYNSTADEILLAQGPVTQNTATGNISYDYISLPLGIRHYMFLNSESSIFLDAGINSNIDMGGSEIQLNILLNGEQSNTIEFEIESSISLFFGIGFNYNKKISVEGRLNTNKKLLKNSDISADYSSVGLVLGYKFL